MIILDVADYCHTCDGFEPKLLKLDVSAVDSADNIQTVIRCEHSRKCFNMYRHISKEVLKNDANGI